MCLFKSQNSINQFLTTINGFEITLKREDQLHPIVSGNKFRKLKYNLKKAQQDGYQTLLTFGGPFSNHLAATAAAGKIMGFKTIGLVRGEEERSMNSTLKFCQDQGMTLFPISRAEYRKKNQISLAGSSWAYSPHAVRPTARPKRPPNRPPTPSARTVRPSHAGR